MGGKVLELPSDKLREERAKGIEVLLETCKEFGSTREAAKSNLISKYQLSEEQAEKYMREYWK